MVKEHRLTKTLILFSLILLLLPSVFSAQQVCVSQGWFRPQICYDHSLSVAGTGTLNSFPYWNSTNNLISSIMYFNTTTNFIGVNTTAPSKALDVRGSLIATDYYSGDGTLGFTGTCTILGLTSITVKDGLITGCT